MAENPNPGDEKAWELLAAMKPSDVSRAGGVAYDEQAGRYVVPSFGMNFFVSPSDRIIACESESGLILLTNLAYFFRLSILWYVVSARDVAARAGP